MSKWAYRLAGIAALSGALGVAEAAAAAHAIANPLLKTSADFLLFNAVAVIAISSIAVGASNSKAILIGAATLLFGGFLFCGELSVHVLLAKAALPTLAPIGGTLMIVGWLIVGATTLSAGFKPHSRF